MKFNSLNCTFFSPTIIPSNNDHIVNKDAIYFIKTLDIKCELTKLSPYQYCDKQYSYSYYLFKNIQLNNTNICLFSDNIIDIDNINLIFNLSVLLTKNKLCNYPNKYIVNESICNNRFNKKLNTVIIYNYVFKHLFLNTLLVMTLQIQNDELLLVLPSFTRECYINLFFFLLQYYSIEVTRPFICPLYDNNVLLRCKRNKIIFTNSTQFINAIKNSDLDYFIFNKEKYNLLYIKKIIKYNLLFYSNFFNLFQQIQNNTIDNDDKKICLFVSKWFL